jgi:hypothetical protein
MPDRQPIVPLESVPMPNLDLSRAASVFGMILLGILLLGGGILFVISSASAGPVSLAIAVIGAGGVVLLLLRLDIGRFLAALEILGVVLPIAAYVAVTDLMKPTVGTLRFAEVGAQVIVVLLLALAVDARFFRLRPDRDRLETAAILLTMMLLASGEYYALRALLTGDPRHSEVIAGAIAAGFTGVAVTAIMGSGRGREERERRDSNPRPPA